MKKYSEFINFPIHLWASKEVDEEVPADEDESSDEDETCMHDVYIFLKEVHFLYCSSDAYLDMLSKLTCLLFHIHLLIAIHNDVSS